MIVHRFTLGGVTDTALGIQLLAGYDDPAAPSTRDRTLEIPGKHGTWNFGAVMTEKEFNLRCAFVDCTSQATLQAAIRTLNDLLFDNDGKPEDLALVFDKEPNYTYTVRYKGSLPILRLVGATVGEFNLPLVAADPYAYGAEDTDTANVIAAYQTMSVENAGDYRTPPVLTITMKAGSGDVTGFTLICRQLK